MFFYKNTQLETSKKILIYIFLFAMIIMVANGTLLGTDIDWKKNKNVKPLGRKPYFKHFHSKARVPCYQK